jgi:hypothetical protein
LTEEELTENETQVTRKPAPLVLKEKESGDSLQGNRSRFNNMDSVSPLCTKCSNDYRDRYRICFPIRHLNKTVCFPKEVPDRIPEIAIPEIRRFIQNVPCLPRNFLKTPYFYSEALSGGISYVLPDTTCYALHE